MEVLQSPISALLGVPRNHSLGHFGVFNIRARFRKAIFCGDLPGQVLPHFLPWGLRVFIFFVVVVCPVTHKKQKLLGGRLASV